MNFESSAPIFVVQEIKETNKQDFPLHVSIDSESIQVDSTNIIVDEEEKDPFKDLGPMVVGNIVEYSNTTDGEGEVDEQKKDIEKRKEEEAKLVVEKEEEYRLKGTWKSVIQESLLMPQLKQVVTEVGKV